MNLRGRLTRLEEELFGPAIEAAEAELAEEAAAEAELEQVLADFRAATGGTEEEFFCLMRNEGVHTSGYVDPSEYAQPGDKEILTAYYHRMHAAFYKLHPEDAPPGGWWNGMHLTE